MTGTQLPEQAIAALNLGRKIEAIKIVRESSGLGLKDAKGLVDAYVATQPHLQDKLAATTTVTIRGCVFFLLGLLAALAAVIHLWTRKG